MLYNYVSVSAVQWSGSAICKHASLPLGPPSYPPSTPLSHHRAPSGAACSLQRVPTICLTHGGAYTKLPNSQLTWLFLPSPTSTHSFSYLCLYSCPEIGSSIHFPINRMHISTLMYSDGFSLTPFYVTGSTNNSILFLSVSK